MISDQIKNLLIKIFINLSLTGGSLIVVLSLLYGQFPPPIGRFSTQIKETQNSPPPNPSETKRILEPQQSREAALAEAVTDAENEVAAIPPPQAPKIHEETIRISAASSPPDVMAELRVIRFKLQTLEAHQQEMRQWMEHMRAAASASRAREKKSKTE
jgi:hypothetical protein